MKNSEDHADHPHEKTARQGSAARPSSKKKNAQKCYHGSSSGSRSSVSGAKRDARRKEQKLCDKRKATSCRRPYPYREAGKRLHELRRIFAVRYPDATFPDDDAGRDDAQILLETWASILSAEAAVIAEDLASRAPWLTVERALALIERARASGVRHRAEELGNRLNLSREDRTRLGVTTIRWAGCTDADMKASRRERDAARKRAARAARAFASAEKMTLSALRPWEAEGISRRTWYRRLSAADASCATAPDPVGTKPVRTIIILDNGADASCATGCHPHPPCDVAPEADQTGAPDFSGDQAPHSAWGGAPQAPPPNRKETPMFKSVLRGMPKPLRRLVYMNGAGEVGVETQADADDLEAIAEFLGAAYHSWRTTRGLTKSEREEATEIIAALTHRVDNARFQIWSRPSVNIEPQHLVPPVGATVH